METCKGKHCPLVDGICIEHRCTFYQHITGQNPQSGEQFDIWDCSYRVHNILLLENSNLQRLTGHAVDALRAESSTHTLQGVGRVLGAIAEKAKLEDKS